MSISYLKYFKYQTDNSLIEKLVFKNIITITLQILLIVIL